MNCNVKFSVQIIDINAVMSIEHKVKLHVSFVRPIPTFRILPIISYLRSLSTHPGDDRCLVSIRAVFLLLGNTWFVIFWSSFAQYDQVVVLKCGDFHVLNTNSSVGDILLISINLLFKQVQFKTDPSKNSSSSNNNKTHKTTTHYIKAKWKQNKTMHPLKTTTNNSSTLPLKQDKRLLKIHQNDMPFHYCLNWRKIKKSVFRNE